MTPADLLAALKSAGLTVKTYGGWESRGSAWADGQPVGVMHHHTAPPVPYPVDDLAGHDSGKIKANINTKPDGTVWLVAWEATNYSSGSGSSKVLSEVRAGTPPSANAKDRNLADDTNGNPYFWNFENDHPGNGSAIPAVQYEALVTATTVVLDCFGLDPGNVISHAEWTARKSDPYWNGNRRCIEDIRSDLMGLTEADLDKIRELIVDVLGGDRVTWEVPGQEGRRAGNNGVLNSALWPIYAGQPIVRTIDAIYDATQASLAILKDTSPTRSRHDEAET